VGGGPPRGTFYYLNQLPEQNHTRSVNSQHCLGCKTGRVWLFEFVNKTAAKFRIGRVGGRHSVEAGGLIQVGLVLREQSEALITTPTTKTCRTGGIMR